MTTTKALVLAGALLTAAGCATGEGYRKQMESWVGVPAPTLVGQLGPPSSTFELNGVQYFTYVRSSTVHLAGTPPTYQTTCSFGICTTQAIGGSPPQTFTGRCTTTFTILANKVQQVRFEGNNCKA